MKNTLLCLILFFALLGCKQQQKTESPQPYLIIVSMDGLRWDYPDRAYTPTFDSIEKVGVKAQGLIPSFPSKTFPNHYSLATGLYPDNHGIVLNQFHDPELNMDYAISDRESVENPIFYGGEPIWVTAEKQSMITASYFWVGSEAKIKGIQPTFTKKYDHHFPFENRVDSVINWLDMPYAERPHLVMLYFHEPDHIGHVFGPVSDSINQCVEDLDMLLNKLCQKINKLNIKDSVNLIVLADHGMMQIDQVVYLDQFIDTNWFERIVGYNPNFCFEPKPEYFDTAFAALQAIEGITTWKSGELPERLHYGHNPRTLDIICVANENYGVGFSWQKGDINGAHGYDNAFTDMQAIFYASGPAFKKNFKSGTFENVNIYPLAAEILNIIPEKVDGSIENVKHLLIGN
jgi:predicted AlkP superfamily pyrophosphatase or phosphodiesterase